jgi:hypothetical protein
MTWSKGLKGRRIVAFTVLLCSLVSGVGSPAVTGAADLPAVAEESASSSSPSSDRDYDGLPDDVETGGWSNAAGSFTTFPNDPDSDDDGLSDGKEKLYDTDPRDDHSPGIYVEYEDDLMTRQYFSREPYPDQPYPWGWQTFGDQIVSFTAVVVRRGATFSVGGPADATIEITKTYSSLTTLTPVRDVCNGRWRISVPSEARVGEYDIVVSDGGWSKRLDLYVIFELPTPGGDLTQEMIDAFLYDDDPDNLRDERGVLLNSYGMEYGHDDYPTRIPEGAWINTGNVYHFELQQFEPFVFVDHVMPAINGHSDYWDAAEDLIERADQYTRFNNPRPFTSSWRTLNPGSDDSNQCSNIAGLLTAFERAAGIPARVFFTDWVHSSFDNAVEVWLSDGWWSARAYRVLEPEGCLEDPPNYCAGGYWAPTERRRWGRRNYRPWHSGADGNSSVVASLREDWPLELGGGVEYRWPSWDWDAIGRRDWFQTLFDPYWESYGWHDEPTVIGGPSQWPAIRDFSLDVSEDSQTVSLENETQYHVHLDTSDGFSNGVYLADNYDVPYVNGLPSGVTVEYNDDYCVPDCSSTLTVIPSTSTPVGAYELTIRGESGYFDEVDGFWREDTTWFYVTDFSIDAEPETQAVRAGDSADYTVTLDPSEYFNDTVVMSVEGLPSGAAADFQYDNWGLPYSDNTLTIDTSTSTPAGDYTLTIRGTVGALVRETTVELSVTDFTIGASPGSRTVDQGESTNYTVNLGAVNGFDSSVNLSIAGAGLPSGTGANFGPVSCTPNCTSTLSVFTGSSTPTGTHTLTIRGTSGSLHHETTVNLTVNEASGGAGIGFPAGPFVASVGEVSDELASFGVPRGHYLFKPVGQFSVQPSVQPSVASPVSLDETSGGDWVVGFGETGLAARGVDDYGVDLDGDGYFDQLVVEVAFDLGDAQPGIYWIQGELGVDRQEPAQAWIGDLIASTVVQVDLGAEADSETNVVRLLFDGLRVSAGKVDGPYVLKYLSITNVDDPETDDFVNQSLGRWMSLYDTDSYQFRDFQNWGALLSGQVSERGLDADADGRYEALILDVGLDIFEPGSYTVAGELHDGQGNSVGRATWTGTGSTAALQFDGLAGTVGPYTLQEASLLNVDGEAIDWAVEVYTTQQVTRAEGRTHISDQADWGEVLVQDISPGPYADAGVDLDDDGLYDLLEIDVDIEVEEAGLHRLEGWLEGPGGALVSWASTEPVSLTEGVQLITLAFSGPAINAHRADGPYTLVALKLIGGAGYNVLDEVDIAYTTSVYTYDQFDSLPYFDPVLNEVLFEDHMENGDGNWTAESPWAIVTAESNSPTHAWTDSPGGDYGNGTDVSLTMVPITMDQVGWPSVDFQTCYQLEDGYDYGYVEISTNGGVTWTQVSTYTGSTVHWSGETVNLGMVSGVDALQVRFRLESDGGVAEDGWYIDDVGVSFDNDLDDDGIPNDVEIGEDPHDPTDTDGDDTPDYLDEDSDDDGIPDQVEAGDDPPNPVDSDGDGTPDYRDEDSDDDGIPDKVEGGGDTDGDGTPDYLDDDADGDGIPDDVEAGDDPTDPVDTDDDGTPDFQDEDSDDDGIPDDVEAGDDPTDPVDSDGDGTPDYRDEDSDDDGIPDEDEAGDAPDNPVDTDGDGTPDYLDDDSDNDGLLDSEEGDGDPDGDGVPNYRDNDSDGDGISDGFDPQPAVANEVIYLSLVFR